MKEKLTMGCTECKKELLILQLDSTEQLFCYHCDDFKDDYTWIPIKVNTQIDDMLLKIFG